VLGAEGKAGEGVMGDVLVAGTGCDPVAVVDVVVPEGLTTIVADMVGPWTEQ
jgi:hypothetical protein